MEDKILKTIVVMAAENVALELRKYSPDPMMCQITVLSHFNENKETTEPEGEPDFYKIEVRLDDEGAVPIIDETVKVFYSEDKFGRIEGIRRTMKTGEEANDE